MQLQKITSLRGKSLLELIAVAALLAITGALCYRGLSQVYFQQDEWHSFVWMLARQERGWLAIFIEPFTTSSRPLGQLWYHVQFLAFGFQTTGYYVLNLVLHTINGVLLYALTAKLFHRRAIALIAALVFIASAVSSQAVTWVSSSAADLPCAMLALIAAICFTHYLSGASRRWYYASLLALVVSLGFKQSTLPLLLLWPVIEYVARGRSDRALKEFCTEQIPFAALAGVLLSAFLVNHALTAPIAQAGVPTSGGTGAAVARIAGNLVRYPLGGLGQLYIPQDAMLGLASWLTTALGAGQADQRRYSETVVAECLSLIAAGLLILGTALWLRRKPRQTQLLGWGTVLFILASLTPYALLTRGSAYLESRYYYLAMLGAAVLLANLVFALANALSTRLRKPALATALAATIVAPYLIWHAAHMHARVLALTQQGVERQAIIAAVEAELPELPAKAVFFTRSDREYYGQDHPLMPFQSGFGELLMVLYARREQLPLQFFDDEFLWDLNSQGYREIGARSFGYFREWEALLGAAAAHGITTEQVFGLEWRDGQISDITAEVRAEFREGMDESQLRELVGAAAGDARWVYFHLANGLNAQAQQLIGRPTEGPARADHLTTARTFTHSGWVGALLSHHLSGSDSATLALPHSLYGYDIVNIGTVKVENRIVTPLSYRRTARGWEIALPEAVAPGALIAVDCWVSVFEVELRADAPIDLAAVNPKDVARIAKTETLERTVEGSGTTFALAASGRISALPTNARGQSIVFIDGAAVATVGLSGFGSSAVTVVLAEAPPPGAHLTVPVLVEQPR